MDRKERRSIDWRVTFSDDVPHAKLVTPPTQTSELACMTSAVMADPSPEVVDRLLRCAVEFARNVIGLERAAIFLFDNECKAMAGTWGTSEEAETISEHDVQYDFGDIDREVFTRSEQGFAWTVYEDCPHIAQVDAQTKVLGRGWVSCTAITGTQGPLGILFNDTALSHSEFDEAKQARAAVLCSILGRALSTSRISPHPPREGEKKAQHRVVREVTQLLAREPSLSCEALAKRLKMRSGQLALTFKQHALTSIVDHRNEIRLARFLERVDTLAGNLREAALEAGFGSYAQFHRVFRARFGQAPRDYLLERRNSV